MQDTFCIGSHFEEETFCGEKFCVKKHCVGKHFLGTYFVGKRFVSAPEYRQIQNPINSNLKSNPNLSSTIFKQGIAFQIKEKISRKIQKIQKKDRT